MIHLRLLGGAWLESPAGPIAGRAAQRQRIALLAHLAIAHPRPVTRDRLIADLWPESETEHARHLLRDSLYVLRTGLGQDVLFTTGDDVRLDPEHVRCDVWEFETALAERRLEDAVGVYGGPFLDGVHLAEADEFERWSETQRQRLATRYAQALEALAVRARAAGAAPAAARWWRRLADVDRFNGRIALELMRALDAAGDRAGALRHAHVHTVLLREEFGAEADPDVRALADQLRLRPATRAATAAEPPVVVEEPIVPAAPGSALAPATSAYATNPSQPDPTLDDVVSESARLATPAVAPRSRFYLRLAAVPVVLGLAVIVGGALLRADTSDLSTQRIAIDLFENRTGDPALDPLGSMVADWITQGLSEAGMAEVVPATTIARWLPRGGASGPQRASLLARETGSGIIVSGAYYRAGDTLHFQARITDGRGGRLLRAIGPIAGTVASPLIGVDELRQRVLAGMLALREPRLALSAGAFGQPPAYAAYREYLEGLQLQWDWEFARAYEHFERAAQLDSTWIIPVLGMAMVAANGGRFEKADSLARIVDRARERLAPFEQANLDLVFAWVRRDRIAAHAAAVRAARLLPGSAQEIQVGIEALNLNRPREAVRVLSRMDPTRGVVRHNSSYWDYLARAYHLTGQHQRELDAARNGRQAHPANSLLVLAELRALVALGRIGDVERLGNELLGTPPRRPLTTGWVLVWTAAELRSHGHVEAGDRLAQQALRWWDQVPESDRDSEDFRRMYGIALYFADRLDESHRFFSLLLEQRPRDVEAHVALGVLAARRGDRAEAERMERWLAETTEAPTLFDSPTMFRAYIAARLGERDRAVELVRQAFAQGRPHDIYLHTDPDLALLRGYAPFERLMRSRE